MFGGRASVLFSDPPTDTFLAHCNLLFADVADLSAEERTKRKREKAREEEAVFSRAASSALGISHFDDFPSGGAAHPLL